MAQSIPPVDFTDAVRNQIELWEESREVVKTACDDIYAGTSPPLIITDETVGGHEYDEAKTERERRGIIEKHPRVQQVAHINSTTRESISTGKYESPQDQWEDLATRREGTFGGMHLVTKREDIEIYIYGTPDLITFSEGKPTHVLQLRGTQKQYVTRDQPFPNMAVAPWITCRILEREGFNVDDLSFTVLRYDREGMDVDRAVLLAQLQHLISSASKPLSDGGINRALNGLHNDGSGFQQFAKDTFEYEQRFSFDHVSFNDRLARSLRIVCADDFLD